MHDAHVAHVLVEDLVVLLDECRVKLSRKLMIPAAQQRAQLLEQHLAQAHARRDELLAHARGNAKLPKGLAADRIVRARIVLDEEGHVILEAHGQAHHVQDDGGGGRLERASVEVGRLVSELEHALDERLGRVHQLVEQHMVRCAEKLGRRGGHIHRFELSRVLR